MTETSAVTELSAVAVTVMVQDPSAFAVTVPFPSTVAMDVSEEAKETPESEAFSAFAVIFALFPVLRDREAGVRAMETGLSASSFTSIEMLPVASPLPVFAVHRIWVFPGAMPVTSPFPSTEAMEVLLDFQV